MKRMGIITAPNGTPVALETVTVKNHATGTVHSTSATNAAGRWDADIADETQAYRVEIGGASGGTQRVVQAPASIELEWLFVRYGMKVVGGPVELPANTTVGGVSISQATLDARYVNVAGDTMTGDLGQVASVSVGHSITQYTTDILGPHLLFQKGRGNATTRTPVANGDILGDVVFQGWDGASILNGALVRVSVDGAPGVNDLPGRITFLTTPDGSTALTERLSLRADGLVTIPGRMTVSGSVLAGWGSAGTPGFAFVGDENTGLFRNNEGQISLVSNGVIRLSMTGGGADVVGALGVTGGATVGSGLNVTAGGATLIGDVTTAGNVLDGEPAFKVHNLAITGGGPTFVNLMFAVDHDGALRFNDSFLSGIGYNAWNTLPQSGKKRITIKNEHGGVIGYIPLYA